VSRRDDRRTILTAERDADRALDAVAAERDPGAAWPGLAAFAADVTVAVDGPPPPPSPALAALMRATPRRQRTARLSVAARLTLGVVAGSGLTAAAATDVLPRTLGEMLRPVIEAVTPAHSDPLPPGDDARISPPPAPEMDRPPPGPVPGAARGDHRPRRGDGPSSAPGQAEPEGAKPEDTGKPEHASTSNRQPEGAAPSEGENQAAGGAGKPVTPKGKGTPDDGAAGPPATPPGQPGGGHGQGDGPPGQVDAGSHETHGGRADPARGGGPGDEGPPARVPPPGANGPASGTPGGKPEGKPTSGPPSELGAAHAAEPVGPDAAARP
jgi:hypothetical protein